MTEWLKILISALAGMVTASLLEPVKHIINTRIRKREAQQALYREIAFAYHGFTEQLSTRGVDEVMQEVAVEAVWFFWESKREELYLVPHYRTIVGNLGQLRNLKAKYDKDGRIDEAEIKHWVHTVEVLLMTNIIETKLFFRELDKVSTFMDDSIARMNRLQKQVLDKRNKEMPSILRG